MANKNLNIWIIKIGEPAVYHKSHKKIKPMRSALLTSEFAKNKKNKVVWWTGNFQHHNKKFIRKNNPSFEESIGNIKIKYIESTGYKNNISLSRVIDHLLIAKNFKKQSKLEARPDVIICSWPPIELAYEAFIYAQKRNIPFILDVRDLWPDVIYDTFNNNFILKKLVNLFLNYEKKMKQCMQNADALISVSEKVMNWAYLRSGRSKKSPSHISNLSSINLSEISFKGQGVEKKFNDIGVFNDETVTRIIFVGTLLNYKPFIQLIKNNSNVLKKNNIQIVICGTGQLEDYLLRNTFENIVYAGYINLFEYAYLCRISHYGIAPFLSRWDLSVNIPNKVGEYLSGGLSLISTKHSELNKILGPYGIHHEFDIELPEEHTRILEFASKNKENLAHAKINSTKAYKKYFATDNIYAELSEFVINQLEK